MFQRVEKTHQPMLSITFLITLLLMTSAHGIDQFEIDWVTPPPSIVAADVGKVYRIGCRLTLNYSSSTYNNSSLQLNDWKLIAEISPVFALILVDSPLINVSYKSRSQSDHYNIFYFQSPHTKGIERSLPSIQLSEIVTHSQRANDNNEIQSLSKIFEYKPERKDSNSYFRCVAMVENLRSSHEFIYNHELTIAEQFQVQYSPVGIKPFDDSQSSGRQIIIDVVNGKDIIIQVPFYANPSPHNSKSKHLINRIYC